ncbi:MAG: KTSC domain-containing protein [Dokdonella sp.]|uniref:KTSC domain-containing protein n=1 Tax=Dokdonella sp. TaxID=2291710 RepID=UPI003F7E4D49
MLLSTYGSIEDMAHRYLLPGFLVRFPWNNVARVRAYDGPVFIEHGRRDAVIPYARGGRRLAAAPPDARFVTLDCGLDDCAFDRTVFGGVLGAWLGEALSERGPRRAGAAALDGRVAPAHGGPAQHGKPSMDMIPVHSSAIGAIGYDAATRLMKIRFVDGNTYDFCGVPPQVFEGLRTAPSPGRYYADNVRDRYPCH